MKKKSFNALTVVTLLVVVAAAYAVLQRSAAKAAQEEYGSLFVGLDKRLNDVAEVQVVQGDKTLTIRRDGAKWAVVERSGYPAKFDRVKETLMTLAELAVLEPKTTRPERYESLGVQDPGAGSESKRLSLKDSGGAVLADLIVGNSGGQTGVFVRKPGEPQAFLCEGDIEASVDPSSWIEREILRVDSKDLAEVRVQHHDGEEIRLEALDPSASKFGLVNAPLGRSERYEGVANSIATALQSLSLDDVRPVAEIDFTTDPIATAEYRRKDGEKLVLHLARQEEKTWVRLTSEYVSPPSPAPAEPAAPTAEGEASAAEPEAPEPAEPALESDAVALELAARQRVAEHNERLAPWAFAVPAYKASSIAKRMEELLTPLEPPAPPADAGAPVEDGASAAEGAEEPGGQGDAPLADEQASEEPAADEPAPTEQPAEGETPPEAPPPAEKPGA